MPSFPRKEENTRSTTMGISGLQRLVPYFVLIFFMAGGQTSQDICSPDTLAVYKIQMETHWSEESFPKQYPTFRPPAQFSRLLGMVHDSTFILWREGNDASPIVRVIAEKGTGESLEQQTGVKDTFVAAKVPQGVGSTETIFYSDAKHTQVSVISKIVPSPDWFVGLDSVELCQKGYWVNNLTIETGPIDAGTDNGFTFTAPNWSADPPSPITVITSQEPSHPANSFYYPDRKELPPLVTFHVIKEKVYKEVMRMKSSKSRLEKKPRKTKFPISDPIVVPLPNDAAQTGIVSRTGNLAHSIQKRVHRTRLHKKFARRPVNCVMSQWSSWSSCSASCGVGVQTRIRKVMVRARRGGTPCSREVRQTQWCGEQTNCIDKFFNW